MKENEDDDLAGLIGAASEDEKNGTYITKEQKKEKEFKVKLTEEDVRFLSFNVEKEGTDNIFFAKAFFHSIKIGDFNQKIYCTEKNDGIPCALCKKSKAILAKQTKEKSEANKSIYKTAMGYASREYTIFKILDMGAIKQKVKFWRTVKPISGGSILEKLISAVKMFKKTYPNNKYYDLNEGVTFTLNSVQKTLNTNKNVKYMEVSSIMPHNAPSRIHTEESFIKEIENETIKWTDIFNKFEIKDVFTFQEYVELCAEGNAPFWDKDNKTFVFPNHPELKTKYEKVVIERNSNSAGDDSNEETLEDIENKYSRTLSPEKTIENTSSLDDDDDGDFNDDDDLPF